MVRGSAPSQNDRIPNSRPPMAATTLTGGASECHLPAAKGCHEEHGERDDGAGQVAALHAVDEPVVAVEVMGPECDHCERPEPAP